MDENEDIWDLIRPKIIGSCDRILLDAYVLSIIVKIKNQAAETKKLIRANPDINWNKPIGG